MTVHERFSGFDVKLQIFGLPEASHSRRQMPLRNLYRNRNQDVQEAKEPKEPQEPNPSSKASKKSRLMQAPLVPQVSPEERWKVVGVRAVLVPFWMKQK